MCRNGAACRMHRRPHETPYDEFRESCRRHYQCNPGQRDHNSRAHIYAVLWERHKSPMMYRHWAGISAILDRVEQEERTHQLRLPMEMPG